MVSSLENGCIGPASVLPLEQRSYLLVQSPSDSQCGRLLKMTPSPASDGLYLIAPDARTQAALLIRRARGNRSLAELARSLETSWPSVQRLENPRHSPTLRQLEKAAAALDKRLVLALE